MLPAAQISLCGLRKEQKYFETVRQRIAENWRDYSM
jgi:hypothetical protein